ncbi:hypothetical protein ASF77_21865 [Massilia sp. Leaf139]|nr:hypothetical protein ASF77_21865 [Massilia sp. Leaf139]
MPTVRGSIKGSKKRYAGLAGTPDGFDLIVFKGLEAVRIDWTPLAQQFQQGLYGCIFRRESYEDYVRDYVARILRGDFDDLLVYYKRLRQPLEQYEHNVPSHVRAARIADGFYIAQGRGAQYRNGLDSLPDDDRRA